MKIDMANFTIQQVIISIYVIVKDIIKCEKVFAGFLFFFNQKSQQKLFRTHDTHFNKAIINKVKIREV